MHCTEMPDVSNHWGSINQQYCLNIKFVLYVCRVEIIFAARMITVS